MRAWTTVAAQMLAVLPLSPATAITLREPSPTVSPFPRLISGSTLQHQNTSLYVVSDGENGPEITSRYSITLNTLEHANPGVSCTALQPGQSINMPSLRTPMNYTIASGDTGNSISALHNISFQDLATANPNASWGDLQVGDILQVPEYGSWTNYTAMLGTNATELAAGFCMSLDLLKMANPSVPWPNLTTETLRIPPVPSPCDFSASMSSTMPSDTAATSAMPMAATSLTPSLSSPPLSSGLSASSSSGSGSTSPSISSTQTFISSSQQTNPQGAEVTGDVAVPIVNDSDGKGSLSDSYTHYTGDGSKWPSTAVWQSHSDMVRKNNATFGTGCVQSPPPNTADETSDVFDAIQDAAEKSKLDHRFILAVVLQESSGCVRAVTTTGSVPNPGLMQTHNGTGTCNDPTLKGKMMQPCPRENIVQMITDGVFGTPTGQGLVQAINQANGTGAQKFYQAARLYNSGNYTTLADLGAGQACYASNIANRLMGWVHDVPKCPPPV